MGDFFLIIQRGFRTLRPPMEEASPPSLTAEPSASTDNSLSMALFAYLCRQINLYIKIYG